MLFGPEKHPGDVYGHDLWAARVQDTLCELTAYQAICELVHMPEGKLWGGRYLANIDLLLHVSHMVC